MNTIRKKIGVLLIGIGFAILVGACSTKESPTTIPVWNASYSNQIRLSAYFDTVEYVFLQDHPEGHFITVDKIVFAFERWYILDKNLMSILCFTSEGGFLFKIQSVGKGPGEYALLSSFFIDSTKREIWAHCRMPGKFIVYDEFGTFIREEPCARGGQDMIQTNDGRILMFNMYPYERSNKRLEAGIFYAAENIRDINQIQDFPSGTAYYSSDSRKNFARSEQSVIFLGQSDSLISVAENGKITILGTFNFGKNHPTAHEKMILALSTEIESFLGSGKIIWKDFPVATPQHLFFQFGQGNTVWYGILNRQTNSLTCTQGVMNDLSPYPFGFPIGHKSASHLVGHIPPDYLLAYQESLARMPENSNHEQEYQILSDFLNKAMAKSGHVLVISKLKK